MDEVIEKALNLFSKLKEKLPSNPNVKNDSMRRSIRFEDLDPRNLVNKTMKKYLESL